MFVHYIDQHLIEVEESISCRSRDSAGNRDDRGFIKVLNRTATEFDTRAKNWQGPPLGGSGGMLPRKILKFYSRKDVFSCILKLQTTTFNNQKKITFLDNLILI